MSKAQQNTGATDTRQPAAHVYDVVDIAAKRHTSGNTMQIKIEVIYDEETYKEMIPYLFTQARITFEPYKDQPTLPFDGEDEEE